MPFSPGRSKEGASYTHRAVEGKAAFRGFNPKVPRRMAERTGWRGDVMRNLIAKWLPRLAIFLFLPALGAVSWGELSASAAAAEANFWDKGLHFIAYFGLAGILCVALKGDRRALTATVLIALFGAVLEILQGFTGRDPDVFDELANILGAVAGAGTGWLALRLLRSKTLAA
jgi:VanZ family protein